MIPLSGLRHPADIRIDAEKAFGKSAAVPEQVMEGYCLPMIKLYLLKPPNKHTFKYGTTKMITVDEEVTEVAAVIISIQQCLGEACKCRKITVLNN